MDWNISKSRLLIFVLFAVFGSLFGLDFQSSLFGTEIENEQSKQFVAIPLAWKDENIIRSVLIKLLAKMDNPKGKLLHGKSLQNLFEFQLSLGQGNLHFWLNINGSIVAEDLEEFNQPEDHNQPLVFELLIDFDNKNVLVNGERLPYFRDMIRSDDSLILKLGGDGIENGACIAVQDMNISNQQVKLEYEDKTKYCNPEVDETIINNKNELLEDDRGHGHGTEEKNKEKNNKNDESILEKTKELEDELTPEDIEKQLENEKTVQLSDFEKSELENIDKKLNEIMDQPEILDKFKRTTTSSAEINNEKESPCFPQQRDFCGPNSHECISKSDKDNRNSDAEYQCVCKNGYSGKRCQFSLLPKSCYEAFLLNSGPINEAGVYELDVDGSGPLPSVWATCTKDGVTIVEHNMPNDTVIREIKEEHFDNPVKKGKMFPISYKLFPQLALKQLIQNSYNCKQKISYKCQNSPLAFSSNLTWFELASGEVIKQIGMESESCSCNKNNGCKQRRKCNCDSLEETLDEGYLMNNNAGIMTVFALGSTHGIGTGKLSLSPLMCEGKSGHEIDNSLSFKSKLAALDYTNPDLITNFEFEFRTIQDDIKSLVLFQTGEYIAQLSLKNQHTIVLKISEGQDVLVDTSIMSQLKLNDLIWHRIFIEIIHDEIRLSVDDLNKFETLSKNGLSSNVRFGSFHPELNANDGFIGCIRNVIINHKHVHIKNFIESSNELFGDFCPNLCAGHNCEQKSKCIEHFDTNTRSCKCKNKFIHKGERCEKNLNAGSEISFHDHRHAYLRYNDSELMYNPLNSTIAISVRTDQKQGVILFAHDQSDNILQVHLHDEYSITLTLSNYTGYNTSEIVKCTVYSKKHIEFSDMRWLQIIIERFEDRTTLNVDDEQCEIKGPIILADSDVKINEFGTETKEVIFPPQAAGIIKVIEPFYYLFIGGVNSPYSYDYRIRKSISPIYRSYIPVFLGCAKGLIVGEQFINMKEGGLRPMDKNAIQPGCYTDCESLVCHNGGHCTYLWENRNPLTSELTSCDCSKTSFFGSTCLKDVSVTFDGQHSLLYAISKSHDMDLTYDKRPQSFRFAFSPKVGMKTTQRLATAYFNDGTEFQVALHENHTITVVYTGNSDNVYVFDSNFTDGYRHFFQVDFDPKSSSRIVIDSIRHYFSENITLHLGNVVEFRFGGIITEEGIVIDPYFGCLSNIDIDFHRNSKTIFQPLLYYLDNSKDTSKYLITEPDNNYLLEATTCGKFKVAGVLPSMQRNVEFPPWDAVFQPVDYVPNFTPPEEKEVGPEEGMPFWLWLIIALAVMMILLCCLYYCCCRKTKRDPPIGTGVRPDCDSEEVPLKKFVDEQPSSPISVEDNFDVPKPTQPLFKNGPMKTDRPSVSHSNDDLPPPPEPEPTSNKEYPDIDSMDAYSQDDPNDIDKQLANGFGEEKPNVMDKKTYNMLEKTSPNRASSFGKDDFTKPIHSPKVKLTPAAIPEISNHYHNGV